MVKIVDYKAFKKESGETFFALIVQGGIEAIISKVTGRTYLTAKKALVSCTFDQSTCEGLLGTNLDGRITKIEVEPYTYVVEETGEEIERNHRYVYMSDEEAVMNEHVVHEEI